MSQPAQTTVWKRIRHSLHRLRRPSATILPPLDAYQLWAETYDDVKGNALLWAEESAIMPMLDLLPLEGVSILDAACGTGRYHSVLLRRNPSKVAAVDFSDNMLQKARIKGAGDPRLHFQHARLESLPFKEQTFDFVLCTLALDHLQNLSAGIKELSRVTRGGGTVLISVIHPVAHSLGWMRTFAAGNSQRRAYAAQYYGYSLADYMTAFQSAKLILQTKVEPLIDESLRRFYDDAGRIDLFERYKGYPLLLICLLTKE